MDIIMDMLNPILKLESEFLNLITELDEYKGRFNATHSLAPERLSSLRQVASIESIGSSTRIEGSKLSDSQVENLLSGLNVFSFRSRDEQEVAGYAEAMELVYQSYSEIPLSENHIKQLHQVLLKYSDKDERHRGHYKKFPNHVEAFDENGKSAGVIFQTVSPFDTPEKMSQLVEWTNTELTKKELHPLLILSYFVVYFLYIHPFQDGNGRLSRVLTTLLLLKAYYSYVSYTSLERVIEENKKSYYLSLRAAQSTLEKKDQKLGEWISFFLKCLQKQKRNLELKLESEMLLQQLPTLSAQIVEILKSRGASAVADLVKITQANRNTLKLHLKNLVNQKYIVAEGVRRGTRYRILGINP